LKARVKPDRFDRYSERLDFIHENMSPTLQGHVIRADALFRSDTNRLASPPTSRFRLLLTGNIKTDGTSISGTLNPNLDADIELPNLEHRWKVYLRSRALDRLPGADDSDDTGATRLGVSRMVRKLDIESDVGVRLRIPPVAFAQLKWEPLWSRELWVFRPGQRLFVESGEGFGTLTSFGIHRWCGSEMNRYVQSISALRRTQRSDGWEGEQTFKLGRVEEVLEGIPSWNRVIGDRDIARGENLRFSLFGHSESATTLDGIRLGMVFRRPCRGTWIYLQTTPEVQWKRDNDWRPEYVLKLSLDMLFWGMLER
jgi:hypothetical protein